MQVIYPVSYAKARTVEQILAMLRTYPSQKMNTAEALGGLTMEFKFRSKTMPQGSASLSEIYRVFGLSQVRVVAEDGVVDLAYMQQQDRWFQLTDRQASPKTVTAPTPDSSPTRVIWKYHLCLDGSIDLEIPKFATILTLQVQGVTPTIWVLVDPTAPKEKRRFTIYATGEEMEYVSTRKYVGTYQEPPLVWHVFEEAHPSSRSTCIN